MIQGHPFENIFRAAAADVAAQKIHPGQDLPGLWNLGGVHPVNVVVVAIVAGALARVAKERGIEFEPVLKRYVELSPEVPFRAVGDPAIVAKTHLQDVSRRAAEQRALAAQAQA